MARIETERSRKQIAQEMRGVENTIAMYREMLDVARRFRGEYEIERLTATLAEFEGERDAVIERAIAAGFGPDDIA